MTVEHWENILTWVSLIGTPFSFLFAILTWRNTVNLKTQIDSKLDLKELSENIDEYNKMLDTYKNFIQENTFTPKIINDLRNLFDEIRHRYPHINKEILSNLKEGVYLLSLEPDKQENQSIKDKLVEKITFIRFHLYKEVR